MSESRAIKQTFGVPSVTNQEQIFHKNVLASTDNLRGGGRASATGAVVIKDIDADAWAGGVFGICTPGSDTPGMNAVIKAVYRIGAFFGCKMKYINHGFQGMVIGGDNFEDATFESQLDIINKGGTILKSYKCPEFKEHQSRLKAAENLVRAGVSKLICIGGDGTLRAIDLFYEEWFDLLTELYEHKRITRDEVKAHRFLQVCLNTSMLN